MLVKCFSIDDTLSPKRRRISASGGSNDKGGEGRTKGVGISDAPYQWPEDLQNLAPWVLMIRLPYGDASEKDYCT
jgi:hypothetical protein